MSIRVCGKWPDNCTAREDRNPGPCTRIDCEWDTRPVPPIQRIDEAPARPALLVERESTHGSFAHNAMISQELKTIFAQPRPGIRPPSLSVHREALDMIALKLSRILSGQADFKDHWRDISGYALLAMEACSK